MSQKVLETEDIAMFFRVTTLVQIVFTQLFFGLAIYFFFY